jgi:hypothetical protein
MGAPEKPWSLSSRGSGFHYFSASLKFPSLELT